MQPTPIADYRREFYDYKYWKQVGSNGKVAREDGESSQPEEEAETDNHLVALQPGTGWGNSVNSAGIGRVSRLELAESER